MNITETLIETLLKHRFEIDCAEITLTQNKSDFPKVYSGPGTIYQKEDGSLEFKVFHKCNSTTDSSFIVSNSEVGKIIPNERYYNLRAVDINGDVWTSERILLKNEYMLFPSQTVIIKNHLRKITHTTPRADSQEKRSLIIVPTKLGLPYNKYEETNQNGLILNHCIVNHQDIEIEFKEQDEYTSIYTKSNLTIIDEKFKDILIEAINITQGALSPISLLSLHIDDYIKTTIYSIVDNKLNNELPSFVSMKRPDEFESFSKFIICYIEKIKSAHGDFYSYWYKINRSYQAGIDTSALSLTVAIEGIVKKKFLQFGKVDELTLAKINQAKRAIKNTKINTEIKYRLLSLNGQIKNPTIKSALKGLCSNGCIENIHLDGWVKLRNQSAHADDMENTVTAQQILIDNYFVCLTLFYMLFLSNINYDGLFTCFHVSGWPTKKLPPISVENI